MTENALSVALAYTAAIEEKNRDAIEKLLHDDVRIIFPISAAPTGRPEGIFLGKDEALAYMDAIFSKFIHLRWPDPDWTLSADGTRAFMQGRGDAVVTHSGVPYRNAYIVRIDVHDGLITQIMEYANGVLYMALQIPPTEVEIRAVHRVADQE
jgi:ketosteroid isomerase-like protein